jgi:small redox-active disulfide protein 2
MTIQVLGSGCPTCKKLFELTKQAVIELNLGVEVEYINDIEKIMAMGVMSSPVLAVNNKAVIAGQLPGLEKIKVLLTTEQRSTPKKESGCCSCGGQC